MKNSQQYHAEAGEANAQNANATNPDAARVFLGFSGSAGESRAKAGSLSQPMVVAGFLFVVGAATLFSMRYFGPDSVKLDTNAPVYTPSSFAATDARRAEELIALLDRSSKPLQFPPEMVLASPFVDPAKVEEVVEIDPAAEAERAARERLRQVQDRFDRLELQSVIGGRHPVARINGQIYQPGDMVDEIFEIEQISGRGVLLRALDKRFVLVPNAG